MIDLRSLIVIHHGFQVRKICEGNKILSHSFIIIRQLRKASLQVFFFAGYSTISWRWWPRIGASAWPSGPSARCQGRPMCRIGPPIWSSASIRCQCFSMVLAYLSLMLTSPTNSLRTSWYRHESYFSKWSYLSSPMPPLRTNSSWSHNFFTSLQQLR